MGRYVLISIIFIKISKFICHLYSILLKLYIPKYFANVISLNSYSNTVQNPGVLKFLSSSHFIEANFEYPISNRDLEKVIFQIAFI